MVGKAQLFRKNGICRTFVISLSVISYYKGAKDKLEGEYFVRSLSTTFAGVLLDTIKNKLSDQCLLTCV